MEGLDLQPDMETPPVAHFGNPSACRELPGGRPRGRLGRRSAVQSTECLRAHTATV